MYCLWRYPEQNYAISLGDSLKFVINILLLLLLFIINKNGVILHNFDAILSWPPDSSLVLWRQERFHVSKIFKEIKHAFIKGKIWKWNYNYFNGNIYSALPCFHIEGISNSWLLATWWTAIPNNGASLLYPYAKLLPERAGQWQEDPGYSGSSL